MRDILAEATLDGFLAARYCAGPGLPDGRAWERAVGTLLHRPGFSRHQGPGLTTLFGMAALSGCAHELDNVAAGWRGSLLVECKAVSGGISKADVATFELKTLDYYYGQIDTAGRDSWWRILVSAGSVSDSVRILCFRHGIILCDPDRFPLPVLVHAAGVPSADQILPEGLLREVLRLGEDPCAPMQKRWRVVDSDVRMTPRRWSTQDTDDLLWLQDELTAHLFDAYDRETPGRLERRCQRIRSEILTRAA